MSAALHPVQTPRPVPGDRVAAKITAPDGSRKETITLMDGSIVLTREDLALFGDGDPIRGAREIRLMIAAERDRPLKEGHCPRSESASVRIATQADAEALFDLLKIDVAENAERVAPASDERIREHVAAVLKRPNIAGVIDGSDGKPVAVVMLVMIQWWWSNAFYYQEMPLFVHPDHRKSTHAKSLLAFQKFWVDTMAESLGYRIHLLCGVLGVKRLRAKTMMYWRMFRMCGSAFLYPWPGGGS